MKHLNSKKGLRAQRPIKQQNQKLQPKHPKLVQVLEAPPDLSPFGIGTVYFPW